jgi:hypothetical protein
VSLWVGRQNHPALEPNDGRRDLFGRLPLSITATLLSPRIRQSSDVEKCAETELKGAKSRVNSISVPKPWDFPPCTEFATIFGYYFGILCVKIDMAASLCSLPHSNEMADSRADGAAETKLLGDVWRTKDLTK